MKKRIVLMGVAAALTATALIGGSLAYFQADGNDVRQQINTKTLGISLKDAKNGNLPSGTVLLPNAMPGEDKELENKLVVSNTGDTPLYTRVTISKSWGAGDENSFVKDSEKDSGAIEFDPGENWYIMENTDGNDENMYLYYTKPVDVNSQTDAVLDRIKIAEDLKNEYADKSIKIDVEGDAVQASQSETAREDAILTEWGVLASFDENGNITSIEE